MTPNTLTYPPYPWFMEYWEQFVAQVESQRLPHAVLLKGVAGIGLQDLAQAMVSYLLCRSPSQKQPCGTCRGCALMAAQSHPDYTHLMPEAKSSVIKVTQVRDLTANLANTAQQGGRKVVLVAPAEAMNIAAANAILKNLEEPADDTVFILLAHQPARVLPTIRSRTAQVALAAPLWPEALAWLNQQMVENAEPLLRAADGAPVKAKAWGQSQFLVTHDDIALCFYQGIMGQISPVDVGKKLSSFDLPIVLDLLLRWLQQAIKMQLAGSQSSLDVVSSLAALPPARLYDLLDTVQGRMAQLNAGSNPNKVLASEEIFLILQGFLAEHARQRGHYQVRI